MEDFGGGSWLSSLLEEEPPSSSAPGFGASRLQSLFGTAPDPTPPPPGYFEPVLGPAPPSTFSSIMGEPAPLLFDNGGAGGLVAGSGGNGASGLVVAPAPAVMMEAEGSEAELQHLFDPLDWPSLARCPPQPAWLTAAFASTVAHPPPGFILPPGYALQNNGMDEANAIHNALVAFLAQPTVSAQQKAVSVACALAWSACFASYSALRVLLSSSPDLSQRCGAQHFESTPLHWAALGGHLTVINSLIGAGAPINVQDSRGRTPLDWAAVSTMGHAVKLLLSFGGTLGVNRSGMDYAAAIGNVRVMAALLQGGNGAINVNRTDQGLRTALHFAAGFGRTAILALLLEARADPRTSVARDGGTPLHWAVASGHEGVAHALLAAGAPPDAADAQGCRPLDVAAAAGKPVLLDMLIKAGAPMLERALLSACKVGRGCTPAHAECVRLLLRAGASPLATDEHGRTALDTCRASGSDLLVPLLLSAAPPTLVIGGNVVRATQPVVPGLGGGSGVPGILVVSGAMGPSSAERGGFSNPSSSRTSPAHSTHTSGRSSPSNAAPSPDAAAAATAAPGPSAASSSAASVGGSAGGGGGGGGGAAAAGGGRGRVPSLSSAAAAAVATATKKGKEAASSGATAPATGSGRKKKDKDKAGSGGGGGGGSNSGKGDADDGGGGVDEPGNVIHVGSLPSAAGGQLWEAIKTTFSQFGTVRQVRMSPHSSFAFVEYESVEQAVRAMETCAGHAMVHGERCTVSWATKRKRKPRKKNQANNAAAHAEASAAAPAAAAPSSGGGGGGGGGGKKKRNACNLFRDTGTCTWGANCKYSHDPNARGGKKKYF